ncbi:DUF4442 domain-containing protein [Mesonia maritima]|uniref:Thioesterase n=1 Tax=Mesonia maritima TaxID=1793873 RepID=A0ABU1K5H9_9FLAO|nr:DUF4442 domain-containing protein [Mesonia maritima]MDR6300870.1 hypothetical protein [Mesonia maritima]
MKLTPTKINNYLLLKLPSAWFCGVRLKEISTEKSRVEVKFRWINQNPFKSMYFAVQAMAAELSTGALVMQAIQEKPEKISMLVASMNAEFLKKATGRISFTCEDGNKLHETLKKVVENKAEGRLCELKSIGKNEAGEVVAIFNFNWTLKAKY